MKKELINLIKQHEVLYDTRNSDYKDIATRNAAWDQIAVFMNNMTVEDCKVEWSKLRNCYVNALKRRRRHLKRGKTLPPWRYEQEMSFIKPYLKERLTGAIRDTRTQDSETDVSIQTSQLDEDVVEQKIERLNYEDLEYMIPENELMKNISTKDETDLFFLGLSQTVKKLPEIEQCSLKMEIFKIVNESEMKFLINDAVEGGSGNNRTGD